MRRAAIGIAVTIAYALGALADATRLYLEARGVHGADLPFIVGLGVLVGYTATQFVKGE